MFDTVAIDFSPDEIEAFYPLTPKDALFNGVESVLPVLSSLENGERVKLQKGDYIDIFYEAPELPQEYGRSFMVDFTGYYHWGLESKSNPVVNSWDNLDYEAIIASVLAVQPEAQKIVNNLEWLFELTVPTFGQSMESKIEHIYVKYALPWMKEN